MAIQKCDDCGFMYENINFCPCPTCKMLGEKMIHVSYKQNEITQGWLDFHNQEDECSYPVPTCEICNKTLGIGDYRDGHHPYHQEYNACKEHKDDYSNSINNNTDS